MNGFHHFENGDRKLPDSLNVLPETSQVQKYQAEQEIKIIVRIMSILSIQ